MTHYGVPVASRSCTCGNDTRPGELFCSPDCASASKPLCECDNPIVVTEDDDEVQEQRCLKCGRRTW